MRLRRKKSRVFAILIPSIETRDDGTYRVFRVVRHEGYAHATADILNGFVCELRIVPPNESTRIARMMRRSFFGALGYHGTMNP